jgi:anti-sigma factor RsiW
VSCDWEAKLDRYADCELPEQEFDEMRAHLLTCASCAAGALGRVETKAMVRAAGRRFRPSPEIRRRVERSIAAPRWNWVARWTPVFAAAVLLIAAGIGLLWLDRSRADQQALSELADLHISTLASANRVDVQSSDRHTVKPWFQGKIPFTFNLPELKDTPFQMIGGRVMYFHQSPGAQLLFAEGKHEISVFLFQDRGPVTRLRRGRSGDGLTFRSETGSASGVRYLIIGDVAQRELHRLSELFKAAAGS